MRHKLLLFALGLLFFQTAFADLASDYRQPKIKADGELVKVLVKPGESKVVVTGSGKTEQKETGIIKYTSASGRMMIPLAQGEAIYGLTERMVSSILLSERALAAVGSLDRRGEKVDMWVQPTYSLYSPFYISSQGYGMFIEGTFPGEYDIGASEADQLMINWETDPKKGFTCYFIFGKDYDQVLERYHALIGKPFLPPKWVFMPWRWRDEHAIWVPAELDGISVNAQVAEDINMMDKLGIPAGVYMIDRPWAQGEMGYGNYTFDEVRFPNAKKMIDALHKRGFRVVVWGAPWALGNGPDEFRAEAKQKGYYAPGSKRNLDYTNPAVVAWHEEKIKTFLKAYGIDGWKLDRGEEEIPDKATDIWRDGRTGREMRNEYPRLYIKTYYDATRSVRGDDFILVPRSSYAGSQQWSINWAGDIPGTQNGLRAALIASQRASFMGYPFWGTDTGGYVEFRDREIFARWIELSTFHGLMEIGGIGNHAPWDMPKKPKYDEEMIAIYKKYSKLRVALQDYIYEQAKKASATGAPVVRPLAFDFPNDEKVKNMWDEFKFGPDLLVAPVWESGKRARQVYLPEGQWVDFWDRSKTYSGPKTIEYAASLDVIPLFIRKGAEAGFAGMEKIQ